MTLLTKKVRKMRVSIGLLGLIFTLGLLTPSVMLVHSLIAAPETKAVVTPAKTVEPAAPVAPAPTTTALTSTPADTTPVVAPVSVKEEQTWWQAALIPVLSVFGMFVAAFLVAGLRKLVKLIENKWKIEIPDAVEQMMYEKARWAIAWVEEKSEKNILHGDGAKTPSAAKLSEVVGILQKFADSLGYGADWQKDKIEALAEGVLHLERGITIGSDGARAVALDKKQV